MGDGRRRRQQTLVLVTVPFDGHMNPMLQLATALQSKGLFSVTIAYILFDESIIPTPSLDHFDFFSFAPLPCDLSSSADLQDFVALSWTMNENLKAPLFDLLAQMKKDEKKDVLCVVYDGVLFYAAEVAEALGIPSIKMHTCSALSIVTSLHCARLRAAYDSSRLHELVPGFEPLRFKDLFLHKLDNLDAWLNLLDSSRKTRASSATIMNTAVCLEGQEIEKLRRESPEVPLFPVGPLHRLSLAKPMRYGDANCFPWLDKQPCNSVIYVSLGSVVRLEKNEFVELAEAMVSSEQRFLWVVRPGSIGGCDWIEALPEDFRDRVGDRGVIVKWATPQREVLSHGAVGGFFSHCGWNSTLEGVTAGVPMICKPRFSDQWTNARWVSHVWRTGMEIESETLERNEIERAIRKLLVEEEGEEMRQRAKDLKDRIEASVSEGGSSYRSLNELVKFIRSI